ncbi:hypothetical protein KI387_042174 [Taxus chinensis]|uniref:Uncharacterized protein n=1 Tax=Taxus chinensis TaxID=29808 RepID=A0AA38C167_TAXCH|nr:hypothetical protein KI387_042174 [Taxus chinensis]
MAHFTANQSTMEAICDTAENGRTIMVHIVDFDIMDGIQWPALMEALYNSNIGVGHMRITAIKWDQKVYSYWKHTGRRLCKHAESMGIPFSFEEKELKDVNSVCAEKDEMIIANCMWRLPHMSHDRSKQKLSDFFNGVRCLRPAILTVGRGAECESNSPDVFSRFVHGLQYSCAMFDSLEAELAEHPLARESIEKLLIGPAVMHMMPCQQNMIHGDQLKTADIPLQSGYKVGVISERNVCQARAIISRQAGKYYGVQVMRDGRLSLTWASVPLLSVNVYVYCRPAHIKLGIRQ